MKTLAIPNAKPSVEAGRILVAALLTAVIVTAFFSFGLARFASIPAFLGFMAAYERLHRLFRQFRAQGNLVASVGVVAIGLALLTLAFFVAWAGLPTRARSGF